MTNNATKSANRGKKRKKPAAAATSAADDEGGESGSSTSAAAAVIMDAQAMRVPGLSADLQQQITKFDSSEFDVSF